LKIASLNSCYDQPLITKGIHHTEATIILLLSSL
jgi:hypothetical protein